MLTSCCFCCRIWLSGVVEFLQDRHGLQLIWPTHKCCFNSTMSESVLCDLAVWWEFTEMVVVHIARCYCIWRMFSPRWVNEEWGMVPDIASTGEAWARHIGWRIRHCEKDLKDKLFGLTTCGNVDHTIATVVHCFDKIHLNCDNASHQLLCRICVFDCYWR